MGGHYAAECCALQSTSPFTSSAKDVDAVDSRHAWGLFRAQVVTVAMDEAPKGGLCKNYLDTPGTWGARIAPHCPFGDRLHWAGDTATLEFVPPIACTTASTESDSYDEKPLYT